MEDSNKLNILPFSDVTKFHGHVCPGSGNIVCIPCFEDSSIK